MPGCLHQKRQVEEIDHESKTAIARCLECGASILMLYTGKTPGEGLSDWQEAHGQRTWRNYGVPLTH